MIRKAIAYLIWIPTVTLWVPFTLLFRVLCKINTSINKGTDKERLVWNWMGIAALETEVLEMIMGDEK